MFKISYRFADLHYIFLIEYKTISFKLIYNGDLCRSTRSKKIMSNIENSKSVKDIFVRTIMQFGATERF